MQHARARDGIRAGLDRLDQMLERAAASVRDHRHADGGSDGRDEVEVVTGPRAFAVDRRDENLAGAKLDTSRGPFHGIDVSRRSTRVGIYPRRSVSVAPNVDRQDDALVSEIECGLSEQLRPFDRLRVHRHLVGTRPEQAAEVLNLAYAAADAQGHEDLLGGLPHDVERDLAAMSAR